jgi:acetyl-CoA/propionyl-CoA carboxylase
MYQDTITWGNDFEESRIRMKNSLSEFTIEGINTTIPLFKTIIDEQNFIKGELSTDYLERFDIINKMNKDAKMRSKESSSAAIATVLLQSEFIKRGQRTISTDASHTNSSWKKVIGRY